MRNSRRSMVLVAPANFLAGSPQQKKFDASHQRARIILHPESRGGGEEPRLIHCVLMYVFRDGARAPRARLAHVEGADQWTGFPSRWRSLCGGETVPWDEAHLSTESCL